MCLPAGLPTFEASNTKNYTRPDNVFSSTLLADTITHCTTVPSIQPPITDHLPIFTSFHLSICTITPAPTRNFRDTDWDDFAADLAKRLPHNKIPGIPKTQYGIKHIATIVIQAILKTIAAKVPLSKPSQYAHRWWNSDLLKMRRRVKWLSHKHYKFRLVPEHPIHAICQRSRNQYTAAIEQAKRDMWIDWLEIATGDSLWRLHKIVTMDHPLSNSAVVPPLVNPTNPTGPLVTSNEGPPLIPIEPVPTFCTKSALLVLEPVLFPYRKWPKMCFCRSKSPYEVHGSNEILDWAVLNIHTK